MTVRMKLIDIEERDKPKRRPIPDHIPRMEIELTPVLITALIVAVACTGSPKM